MKYTIASVFFFLIMPFQIHAEENYLNIKVDKVVSGDTFWADGLKAKLWGIKAPEGTNQYSYVSRLLLEVLTDSQELNCEIIGQDTKLRTILKCKIENTDISSVMVQSGMVKDYFPESSGYYLHEENKAKRQKVGIWNNN